MLGQMMNLPLNISQLLQHAARYHADTEVVTRGVEGTIRRSNYGRIEQRARQLANVLDQLAVPDQARVASLAWNTDRHLELYYASSGSGRILHTVNPRLFPEQIAWIINHAEDDVLFFDLSFVALVEKLAPLCPTVRHWVLMSDAAHAPAASIPGLAIYETLMAVASESYAWPQLAEDLAAVLCYTSGTTGNPKGVLYSHRSTVLHAMACCLPDVMALSARDVVLPVVPMFHVNAWGAPYSCPLVGAKLVLPGAQLDGASLHELFETERVTFSAGVPTVWLGLLQHLQKHALKFTSAWRSVVGGSAVPPALMKTFQDDYGVTIVHAWGMSEMSPLGTYGTLKNKHLALSEDGRFAVRIKQGRPLFGVELKIVDGEGQELPRDGKVFGDVVVRGPWVIDRYYKQDGSPLKDGFFPTGDVGTLDADGYLQITDRSKDVIKSGGEWISSIDLENVAMAHAAVQEAAVIGVHHPKWDERPLLIVVKKPRQGATREELLAHFPGKIAKWWIPDDVVFVDEIPHTATGKISKLQLRQQFKDYKLPTA